jgi:DNA repair exonuclease SbcCD nuclease subunit
MLVIHTADWHIGCCRAFDQYTPDDPPSLTRPRAALDELLTVLVREKPQALVIAGDVFHHPDPTHDERAICADFLQRCPVPVLGITGNHDRYGAGWNDTCLNWLVALGRRSGHLFFDQPGLLYLADVAWIAIPYYKWKSTDFELIVSHFLSQLPARWDKPVIVVAHALFSGAVLDHGGMEVDRVRVPYDERVTYYALGDVHLRQKLGPRAYYSGSMFQTRFGERLPKGVILRDLDHDRQRFVSITSPRQLIQLETLPKTWPDAHVSLRLPEPASEPLPTCVVSVKMERIKETPTPDVEASTESDDENPLVGLREYLSAKIENEATVEFTYDLGKKLVDRLWKPTGV